MRLIRVHFFGTMLAFAAVFAASAPAMAQRFITQEPCTGDASGTCATISPVDLSTRTVRSFTFTTHTSGKALIEFDGTEFCFSSNAGLNVPFNFDTQIVTVPNVDPVATGPGGNRFEQRLGPIAGDTGGSTVNLHSSRVISIRAAGAHSVHLRLRPIAIYVNTGCNLRQNRFTVLFLPAN